MSDDPKLPRQPDPERSGRPVPLGGDLLTEARRHDPALDEIVRRAEKTEVRPIDRKRITVLSELRQEDPDRRRFLLAPQALILCPPPLKRTAERIVSRRCELPGGQAIEVAYAAVRPDAGMVFGRDAVALDVLTAEARRRQAPEITWDTALSLLRDLHIDDGGGEQYRVLRERLKRIRGLHISVIRAGVGAMNIRVVDIDGLDAREDDAKRHLVRPRAFAIRLSPEFFNDVLRWTVRVPKPLIRAFGNSPLKYQTAKWLLWRASYAASATEISWPKLHAERASGYARVRRFRAEVEDTIRELAVAWPLAKEAFSVGPEGLRIRPVDDLLLPDRSQG